MAKKAKKAKKTKIIVIASVKTIKAGLKARRAQATTLVQALESGKKAKKVPMKHAGTPALKTARMIEKSLGEAIQLMDDVCGDNILSNPFVLEEES
ncbi:MAG TPA: hypothetical protein VFO19_13640 [Vicinamibacterales bacterium]|nr:hypothetical protein [Vicinamibacterales bacterium]